MFAPSSIRRSGGESLLWRQAARTLKDSYLPRHRSTSSGDATGRTSGYDVLVSPGRSLIFRGRGLSAAPLHRRGSLWTVVPAIRTSSDSGCSCNEAGMPSSWTLGGAAIVAPGGLVLGLRRRKRRTASQQVQRTPRWLKDFDSRPLLRRLYSNRSASIGSSLEALRAG